MERSVSNGPLWALNLQCPICYENVVEDESFPTPCQHIFHKTCLEGWLNSSRSVRKICLLCEKELFLSPTEMKFKAYKKAKESREKFLLAHTDFQKAVVNPNLTNEQLKALAIALKVAQSNWVQATVEWMKLKSKISVPTQEFTDMNLLKELSILLSLVIGATLAVLSKQYFL